MNVLITGGAGYIGSTLTPRLLELGHKVTVYDSLLYRQTSLLGFCDNPNLTFVHDDVRNQDELKKELNKADVIIPLAAYVGFPICEREKELSTKVNYDQIEFIAKNISSQQKIIFSATNSGYGVGETDVYCTEETPLRPVSRYGIDKSRAEERVLEVGGVSLRLATVFGASPRMRIDLLVNDFTYKAIHDGYIVIFEKHFKRNFIHVRDVVDVFVGMMNHSGVFPAGQAFNVGLSEANLSKLELAETIKKHVPNFIIEVNDFKSDPDKRNYIVSNEKIERFLSWKAKRSLDDGIAELIKAYKMISHSMRTYTNL